MKNSIKEELTAHINDFSQEEQNHFNMFNSDYYIVGYHNAEQWLKRHDLGVFEAIEICNNYENENYGEIQTQFANAERLVNNLVYWYGYDLCNELEIPQE